MARSSIIPTIKLNNGVEMPTLGMGTMEAIFGDLTDNVRQAIKDSIDIGYRLFDCARIYRNEDLIGQAIQDKIKEGKVKREELFIVTKLWMQQHRPELVEAAVRESLQKLQLDYLDLYLIHWPMGLKETGNDDLFSKDPASGKSMFSDVDYVDTWKAMEKLVEKGLVRSIGISNFNSKQIERVLQVASVVPAVNQVELHPYFNQEKLRKFCKSKGIEIMSYSPLAAPNSQHKKPEDPELFKDPKIAMIAKQYNKSVAQILLKWNVQLGNVVIPKSYNKNRLKENFDIFDFELSPQDMNYINKFNTKYRFVNIKELFGDHPHYPFDEEF